MKNLCCELCGQTFPNSRSLGIHMRSHDVEKSEDEPMCRYGFRENPRKSWRLKEKEKDMLCTIYEENSLQSNGSYEEEEDEIPSQSDGKFTDNAGIKRRRSPESSPEEEEKKMGAFCLIMLSRDVHDSGLNDEIMRKRSKLGGLNDDFGTNEIEKVQSCDKNDLNSDVSELGKRISHECTTCNKSFSSYQALGGHMTSHKKIKIPSCSETTATEELGIQNHRSKSGKRNFQCSICSKIFASGQALGGHKRSHFVRANIVMRT